jgi:hypothetical protein
LHNEVFHSSQSSVSIVMLKHRHLNVCNLRRSSGRNEKNVRILVGKSEGDKSFGKSVVERTQILKLILGI